MSSKESVLGVIAAISHVQALTYPLQLSLDDFQSLRLVSRTISHTVSHNIRLQFMAFITTDGKRPSISSDVAPQIFFTIGTDLSLVAGMLEGQMTIEGALEALRDPDVSR